MRFLPISHLQGDEILAVNIINSNLQILVREGATLTEKMITRLRTNGIRSVYIKERNFDHLSDDEVKDVIPTDVRAKSVYTIRKAFERFEKQIHLQKKSLRYGDVGELLFREVKKVSESLIDEVLISKDLNITMIDIKSVDDYSFHHAVNVAVLSLIIGAEIGLSAEELENLAFGALLMNIGNQFMKSELLNSPDTLLPSELEEIREHVKYGYQYITENTIMNAHIKNIILHHHERMNGTGYPLGLEEDNIHPLAKIIMIADVYDALTSDRPFRKAYNQHEAIEYIMGNAGTLFDFKLANIFCRKITPYPVGSYVKLSNDQKGVVIENNKDHPLRPIVRTFGISNITHHSSFQINLLEHTNVVIEKTIYTLH